jgi:hypothetical protein
MDHKEIKERPTPHEGQTAKTQSNLPQTILSHSIQNRLILTHSNSAFNENRRMQRLASLNDKRQILPNVPTLPKKHRHNGNHITALSDKLTQSRRQIRLHQLEKRQRHRPCASRSLPQLDSQPLKRLPPPHIPSAMPKQNDTVHSHSVRS